MLDIDPKPASSPRRALPENLFDLPAAEALASLEGACRRVDSLHDGIATSLRVWGEGEPVVMLHGASGSWRHFARMIPVISRRYQVITADIPGFGTSALPKVPLDLRWLGEAIAKGIDDVVGARGRYHLVPFSFSGQITCHLAPAHCDRIATLNMIGPGGLAPIEMPEAISLRGKRGAERDAAHRFNLLSMMIRDEAKIDALAVLIQDLNTVETRLDLRRVTSRFSLAEALVGSTMPITGIWGADDQFCAGNVNLRAETLRMVRPDAGFVALEGCGHWAMYERADEVNALVLEGLKKARV